MTKFDTEEHLSQWMNSRSRARMLSEAEPLVEASSVRRARTSFDGGWCQTQHRPACGRVRLLSWPGLLSRSW